MVDYIGRMMGLMNDELEARSRGLVEDTTEYSTDWTEKCHGKKPVNLLSDSA